MNISKAQRMFFIVLFVFLINSSAYADPPVFDSFLPANGASGISLAQILEWTAHDPNPAHTLTYDIYFGKTSPPALKYRDQNTTTYEPQLSSLTLYYWQIVARDNEGTETASPILTFTTTNNPPQFSSFSPGNGATGVSLTPGLNWIASDPDGDPVTYDVYFGPSSPPSLVSANQTTRTYQPGQLTHMTVYYWRVVARDNHGIETESSPSSSPFSFTTLNNLPQFNSYSPVNESTGVGLTPTLTWSASDADPDDTLRYDVYFGIAANPPLVSTSQTATIYQPTGLLSYSTRYYWKIVAKDSHNGETSTNIVYFNTISTDFIVDHSSSIVNQPQVTADNKGNVYVVWEDTRNGNPDIYFNYSSDYGESWQTLDIRLDKDTPGTGQSVYPQIACDNSGHVYVVWKDTRSGSSDVYYNYSSNYGHTWQSSDKKLGTLPYNPNNAQFPQIACDNNGHVYVAWNDNYFNTSANYGVTWLLQAKRISTAGGEDTQLLCDQNGSVYVAWRLGTTNVLFNYSTNAGTDWQSPDEVISSTGAIPAGGISLTSDTSGRIYCAWHDTRNSANNPDVYFNSSSDHGVTWGSDAILNTGTPGSTYSIYPEVACDNSGNVYVAWYDRRNGEGDIRLNFYDGLAWQNPDIRLDTDTAGVVDSGFPEIAVDKNANIYAIWSDNQTSIGPGLYLNYSLDSGANWLSTNRKIASGGFYPQMITDGDRLYIVRENSETDSTDVMFTKLAPFVPLEPFPANGAVQVARTPTLTWRGGNLNLDDTLTYDVYFDTSPQPTTLVSPDQVGTTYTPPALNYLTWYYWQVVSREASGATTSGPIWSFRTISTPPQFVTFTPPEGQSGVAIPTVTLLWDVNDPDPGDVITYSVYFGTTNPPPLRPDCPYPYPYSEECGPLSVAHYTVYYWKVVARDQYGSETASPVLSFTTINYPPYFNPNAFTPANGATGVPLTAPDNKLTWSATDPTPGDSITYDVYFGTSPSPPLVVSGQTATFYKPGQLTHLTTYYWKIVARDSHDAITETSVFSFITLNNKPDMSNFSPASESNGVSLNPTLSWSATDPDPDDTITFDVYFGTVKTNLPMVSSNQTGTTYLPGPLTNSTKYYWKIVARDNHGATTTSVLRNFTTVSNPPQFNSADPGNGATGVSPAKMLSWNFSDLDGDPMTFDVYLGSSNPPQLVSENQASILYQPPSQLGVYETYYWKVVACDNHDLCADSGILSFRTGDRPPVFQSFTPPYLATQVSITPTLSWLASDPDIADTLTYDVYFGTSSQSQPLVASNLATNSYQPGRLLASTMYYWRVVARDNHEILGDGIGDEDGICEVGQGEACVQTTGNLMQFSTGNQPYIVSVTPNPSAPLQKITISGERFGATQGTSAIYLGTKVFGPGNIRIKSWSDTQIELKLPSYETWPSPKTKILNLWVKVNNVDSNKVPLTINKP